MTRRTSRRERTPGRPTALNEEVERRLLDAVRAGTPVTQAAIYAGVDPSTFTRWMQRGADETDRVADGEPPDPREEPFRTFRAKVLHARSGMAVRNVALVQRVAGGGYVTRETTRKYRDPETGQLVTETERTYQPPDWRASKWLLETSFARDFSVAQELVVSGPGGGPVQVAQAGSVEVLAGRLHEFAAERREEQAAIEAGDVVDGEVIEEGE